MKEAQFYKRLDHGDVHCFLCAQHCRIKNGARGKCGVRENREGTLYSLVYGRLIARNVDPIEKKPLFHFMPGTRSYSIATAGCNFQCMFCQNADISQVSPGQKIIHGIDAAPETLVQEALRSQSASISYTYTEPTIFMEYALDTAREAQAAGLRNVFVTNGFMTREALDAVTPYLDAANVDLKAFTERFYADHCGARLKPVLDTLRSMKERNVWVEITTLLIPGLNDDPGELRGLAEFILSLGPETPWHVTRFHPTHRMTDRPVTPLKTLERAREIGLEAGLRYVYTGNVPGSEGEHTYCHQCHALLIERYGFSIRRRELAGGVCARCGTAPAGFGV